MEVHCCAYMADRLTDGTAVVYVAKFREYGISVADGGSSFIVIQFCPWCGSRLPTSLRDEWFNALESQGVEPDSETIPQKFLTDAWWRMSS